jgi:hypothetical protein
VKGIELHEVYCPATRELNCCCGTKLEEHPYLRETPLTVAPSKRRAILVL